MMARTRGSSLATRHDESLEILEFALCALKPLLGGVCRLGGTQERIRDPRACGARLFPRLLQQPLRGTSPRLRGYVLEAREPCDGRSDDGEADRWLIPVYAGWRLLHPIDVSSRLVDPRA